MTSIDLRQDTQYNEKPFIFLFGATPHGLELAARGTARLHCGLTADCTALEINEKGELIQTRSALGGNIMASMISPYTRPQMATRPIIKTIKQGRV